MGIHIAEATIELIKYFFFVYTIWLSIIIVLAATGTHCGVRKLFVKTMLNIFEWGAQRMEQHEQKKAETPDQPPGGISRNSSHGSLPRTGSHGTLPRTGSHGTLPRTGSASNLHPRSNSVGSRPDNDDGSLQVINSPQVIERDVVVSTEGFQIHDLEDLRHQFKLSDVMFFTKNGIEAIIEDEVTQRFSAAELPTWNLLTRTNNTPEFISYRLLILYYIGWFLRYIILFPFRCSLAIVAVFILVVGTSMIGFVPNGRVKRFLYIVVSKTAFRLFMRAFSAVLTFHNKENKPMESGICVANHTSPVDIVCLGSDHSYAMVGQQQKGFIHIIQETTHRAASQVWFQRSEAKDRLAVSRRLREHVDNKKNLPILIFPEGTCINNTSIMMFKKGSFELGATIYPIAIKYDSRFADPFWNSSKQSFIQHLLLIMTSWSLVVDVWYLPPQKQRDNEDAIQFAHRIKSLIAKKGGLVELDWDGGLKRSKPKHQLMEIQQTQYSNTLIDLEQSSKTSAESTPENPPTINVIGASPTDEPSEPKFNLQSEEVPDSSSGDDIDEPITIASTGDQLHSDILEQFVSSQKVVKREVKGSVLSNDVKLHNGDVMDCLIGDTLSEKLENTQINGVIVNSFETVKITQTTSTTTTSVEAKKDL